MLWTVSRYLHLNPLRGRRPLATHPGDWRWSSYPGYTRKAARLDLMCYDAVYAAWQGEMDGGDPVAAYRRCVESGIESPPANPLQAAQEGWLLGAATLREVASVFGLGHPDSASNLIRRAESALAQSTKLRSDVENIERLLTNTG